MAPIKVGILGLSASGTSGTSWAERAHLAYLKASPKYELIAVSNSSVASAELAIKTFGLPSTTRAYGNATDLADDPDVELVVCSTRVDKHAETIDPSLRKGKAVFCEWPLGANAAEAQGSLDIARSKGVRTMVGLQGRVATEILKLREVLDSGRIGDVLSTAFTATGGNCGESEAKSIAYFTERKVGGNLATIHLGHTLDYILHSLGEFEAFNSLAAIQRPRVPVIDRATNEVVDTVDRTSFDHITLQGRLQGPGAVKPVLSYHLRGGKAFPSSQKPMVWSIYGTKGEIQITSSTLFLNSGAPDVELWVYENETGKAERVELVEDEFIKGLPLQGQNIAKLYELYAKDEGGYPTFEDAVLRHRLIDEFGARFDDGSQVRKAEYVAA